MKQLTNLNSQWKVYCAEFAKTLDSTKALAKSKFTKRYVTAHSSNKLVQQEIAYQLQEIINISNVDAAVVLNQLVAMMQADIADIVNSTTGQYKVLADWPLVWRQMISSISFHESGIPNNVKFVDRLKVIELTGKHINVAAFEERHTHTHKLSDVLAERITQSRARAGITINHNE